MSLTLDALLTVEGIAAGAVFITTLVALIKNVFARYLAQLDQNGALLAFILSAAMYVAAGFATGATTLDAWFAVLVAWVTCATAAIGVNATIRTTQSPGG